MLLSRKWLDEFVHVDANDKDFAEAMTLSGSKVETTEDRGAEISNIVVGTILTMERHPDSDHMWICQLDVGQSAPIQMEHPPRRYGTRGPGPLHPPRRQEDREGQAAGRGVQRHDVRPL